MKTRHFHGKNRKKVLETKERGRRKIYNEARTSSSVFLNFRIATPSDKRMFHLILMNLVHNLVNSFWDSIVNLWIIQTTFVKNRLDDSKLFLNSGEYSRDLENALSHHEMMIYFIRKLGNLLGISFFLSVRFAFLFSSFLYLWAI